MTDPVPVPGPHRARRFMLVVTAMAAAWIVFEVAWRASGTPAKHVDFGVAATSLVAARQPPGENGWPALIEAGARCREVIRAAEVRQEEILAARGYGRLDFNGMLGAGELDFEHHRFEIDALEAMRRRGVFERLERAAAASRFVRRIEPSSGPLMAIELPELSQLRNLARVRTASMRVAAIRGDDGAMLSALEESLAIGRAVGAQCFIIDRLVGQAIHALVLSELRFLLLEREFDLDTLRAMGEIIDRQATLAPVTLALEGERSMGLDLVQNSFTDNGHGNGQLKAQELGNVNSWAMAGPNNILAMSAVAPFQAGRRETTELLNDFYDALAEEAEFSPLQRANTASPSLRVLGRLGYRHLFIAPLLPAISRAINQADETRFMVAVTRVMVALAEHRARHAAYPERLEELVPDELAEVPADPVHGGSFVYRRAAPGVPGLPYLLYSTGLDQRDDSASLTPAEWETPANFGEMVWGPSSDVLVIRPRPAREERY